MASIVTNSSRKRKNSRTPLFILAAVLVVLAVVFLATRKKPAEPEAPVAPGPVAVTPATPEQDFTGPDRPKIVEPVTETALTKEQELFNKTNNYVKKPGQMMLPNGQILTFPPPKPGEVRLVASNSRIYECDSEGNWRDTTKRNLFDTAFEANFLNLSVEGKTFIPAFLTGLDQDEVIKILKKDYELKGDETEEEMEQIKAYLEMKGAALDYIEEGGTFDDFVTEIASYVQAERQMHVHARKQVMMLFKEGKIEEAREKAAALNAVMEEQGYKPLRLPAHVRRAFGEEE